MPMYSRSNNWASKLVIVLQFTAWISVGIVLLQKGVTSLRSQSAVEAKGTVQATDNDPTYRYLNEKTKRTLDSSNDNKNQRKDGYLDERLYPAKENVSTRHWNRRSSMNEESEEDINILNKNDDELSNERWFSKESNNDEKSRRLQETDMFDLNESSTQRDVHDSLNNSDIIQKKERKLVKESSTLTGWNDEMKIRTRLNTGGAAAAIAMVAVGAAMLVVGPIVIVLRAIDKRRQERRYLKSTTWDDQPPSYEQATLMNEAPRYSTLNLNAVHTSRNSSLPSACTTATPHGRSTPG